MVDFIGLGAQKAGTSWVYACLYEHPEICAPIKELHFFSRSRFQKGKDWYESHFKVCRTGLKVGEFSTSYLYSTQSAERIASLYPHVKLIVILRNPIDRAFSQYINAQKAGEIKKNSSFEAYIHKEKSVMEQGFYMNQLERYFNFFNSDQILILVYEDIQNNPQKFMEKIYTHIGVDPRFRPSMINSRINAARIPCWIGLERCMHRSAELLRTYYLGKVVWFVKKSGLSDLVRTCNTKQNSEVSIKEQQMIDRDYLRDIFKEDVKRLSAVLGRDLNTEWNI